MKILLLDIETAPNLVYVFQLYDQNVSIDQIESPDYILCWAAKWYGDTEVFEAGLNTHSQKAMIRAMWKLLDEADAVVHYNGTKFDIPWLNREFLEVGLTPPSPFKEIDLVRTVKRRFRFPSYKLDFVCQKLKLGKKIKTTFELWHGCIKGLKESWDLMRRYNVNDVILLEKLYVKLLPWIVHHANHSIHNAEDALCCPNCGSTHLVKRGFYRTEASEYQRYKCVDCGKWLRDNKILNRNKFRTVGV